MLTNPALAERLRIAVGRLARRLRQQTISGGLTPSQSAILTSLNRHGPIPMGRLAEVEAVSRPSVTGIVSRLVEKGLVAKRENPDDRRSAIVEITPAGIEVIEERRRERTAFLSTAVESLSDEERLVLARAAELMERITALP